MSWDYINIRRVGDEGKNVGEIIKGRDLCGFIK